jgi:hypothetical protein
MEADVLWKAAAHLSTGLGKRRQKPPTFPTSPTAPASDVKKEMNQEKQPEPANIPPLTQH